MHIHLCWSWVDILRRKMCLSRRSHIWGMGGMQSGEFRLSSAQGTPRCLFLSSLNLPFLAFFPPWQTFWGIAAPLPWDISLLLQTGLLLTSEERCDICKFLPPPSSSRSRGLTAGTWILWERWVAVGCSRSSSSPSSPPPWPAASSRCHRGLSQSDPPLKKKRHKFQSQR